MRKLQLKELISGVRHKRTDPDKRITITKDIVFLEYPNGLDAMFHIDDTRAKRILATISLTATN